MSGEQIVCPGLCSICPSPADKPCPKTVKHTDELIIEQGIGHPKTWGVFRRSGHGGKHRVKSPMLPMVATREECERNLAAYLVKKKGASACGTS